jgi:hypothetical protein
MPRARRDWTFDRWVTLGLAGAAGLAILVLALLRGADLWLRRDRAVEAWAHRAEHFALILS